MARTVLRAAASALWLLARAAPAAAATEDTGSFSVLSFNVAGLPEVLQSNDESGDKETNSGLIGSYFAAYDFDVIHVQEDFNYHAYICKSLFSLFLGFFSFFLSIIIIFILPCLHFYF